MPYQPPPHVTPWPSLAETAPRDSWWTTPQSREEFDAHAAAQRNRMGWSKFGLQMTMGLPGVDALPLTFKK